MPVLPVYRNFGQGSPTDPLVKGGALLPNLTNFTMHAQHTSGAPWRYWRCGLRPLTPFQPTPLPCRKRRKSQYCSRQLVAHVALLPPASLEAALPALLQTPPFRDVVAVLFDVAVAHGLVKAFYLLKNTESIKQTTSRKLVHALAGPMFLLTWPLFSSAPYAPYIAATVPALQIIRFLIVGHGFLDDESSVMAISRTGDPRELLHGPLCYAIVLLAVTCTYWRGALTGLVVVCLMCDGDGLADLVGRRYGKSNPLPWNHGKSWAGSLAMLAGGFASSMAFISLYCWLDYIDCELPDMTLRVGFISLAATAVESLPTGKVGLDDNLTVPAVAALLGSMLL